LVEKNRDAATMPLVGHVHAQIFAKSASDEFVKGAPQADCADQPK
jgi:hypothetical protein